MIRRSLVLLAACVALGACGSEPTAVRAPAEARHNASQLTVHVLGPTQVNPGETAYWEARVAGGTAPYQYSWSGIDTDDNTGYSVMDCFDGYPGAASLMSISVVVTDAVGKKGYGWIDVYVPPSEYGWGCPV